MTVTTAPPGLAVVYKGETVPVTNLIDVNGCDVTDHRLANSVVAGPMRDGNWLMTEVRDGDIIWATR